MTEKKVSQIFVPPEDIALPRPSERIAGFWVYTLLAADPDLIVLVRENADSPFDNILTYPGRPKLIADAVDSRLWEKLFVRVVSAFRTAVENEAKNGQRPNMFLTQADTFAWSKTGMFASKHVICFAQNRPSRGLDVSNISKDNQKILASQMDEALQNEQLSKNYAESLKR